MSQQFDVFNGDADGICALHQLRLAEPLESTLITGLKRDIALLQQVNATAGDRVTVLDISLDKNRDALLALLESGAHIDYFDHHFAGEIPAHSGLNASIDTSADTCTSLLVDEHLEGRFRDWAVAAAFGDNLHDSARRAAQSLALSTTQLEQLCELGTCINYNGYGVELGDLFFHPAELYRLLKPYRNPFDFIAEEPAYQRLRDGYREDMQTASSQQAELATQRVALYILPDEPWARRVSGVFGNSLARQHTHRAHALLTRLNSGGYRVSVRAPLNNKEGADELCRAFPTGGGRKAAAGINLLAEEELGRFIDRFQEQFTVNNA